jgi:hypothetical protein
MSAFLTGDAASPPRRKTPTEPTPSYGLLGNAPTPSSSLKERAVSRRESMSGFVVISALTRGRLERTRGRAMPEEPGPGLPVSPRGCRVWVSGRAGSRTGRARPAEPAPEASLTLAGCAPMIGRPRGENKVYAVVSGCGPHWQSGCWQAAWLRSSLRAGPRRRAAGHGAGPRGQRDQSKRRPRRQAAGAKLSGDHALPASRPAHAACCGVRAARHRACPSRIA